MPVEPTPQREHPLVVRGRSTLRPEFLAQMTAVFGPDTSLHSHHLIQDVSATERTSIGLLHTSDGWGLTCVSFNVGEVEDCFDPFTNQHLSAGADPADNRSRCCWHLTLRDLAGHLVAINREGPQHHDWGLNLAISLRDVLAAVFTVMASLDPDGYHAETVLLALSDPDLAAALTGDE